MKLKRLFLAAMSAALLLPQATSAESNIGVGNPAAASAQLDFRVIIPEFVFFRVGTAGVTVDEVLFDLGTLTVPRYPGDGLPVDATPATDNVTVTVITNDPAGVSLTVAAADLSSGGPEPDIPVTEITATQTTNDVPVPQFGGAPTAAATGIQNDTWSFDFDNSAVYAAATYTTTATYTASSAP